MPHIRFNDEEDDDVEMAEAGEDTLGESSLGRSKPEEPFQSSSPSAGSGDWRRPERKVNVGGQDYVLDISINHDCTMAAASTSGALVKLLSVEDLRPLGDLRGHHGTISSISFLPQRENVLLSSASDGSVRVWDVRSTKETKRYSCQAKDEMWGASVGGSSGNLVAGASNAKIYFWDLRMGKTMAVLEEAHTEEVVQVSFHPQSPDTLLSASVDGLLCVFNTATAIDDEESLQTVMNAGTSVSKFGFYGPSLESLWCLTHIETFSLWTWAGGEQLTVTPGTREQVAEQWPLPTVDYFIGCYDYDWPSGGLAILGGTNDGTFGCFSISPSQGPSKVVHVGKGELVCYRGHTGIVRAAEHVALGKALSQEGMCWLSGGEDGHVCSWGAHVIRAESRRQESSSNTRMQSVKRSEISRARYNPY